MSSGRDLRAAFDRFDRDRSGNLNYAELRKALASVGLTMERKEAKDLLAKYDADGSGEMEFEEFTELCEELEQKEGVQARPPPISF